METWLSHNNWPDLVAQVEKEYLGLEKVQSVRERAEINILAEVAIELEIRKQKFDAERETAFQNGVRFKKQTPKWNKIEREITTEVGFCKCDKTTKNALLLIREGVAYLDFISAYRSGFSERVEKCIEYFAILYQGSTLTNYAGETIHLVACLKRL